MHLFHLSDDCQMLGVVLKNSEPKPPDIGYKNFIDTVARFSDKEISSFGIHLSN
jgi:hypothetical protein